MSMKNPSDIIGNRTWNFLVCSTVPPPTACSPKYRYTLVIFNTYCYSMSTMVTRTRLNVTLYVYFPLCLHFLCPFWQMPPQHLPVCTLTNSLFTNYTITWRLSNWRRHTPPSTAETENEWSRTSASSPCLHSVYGKLLPADSAIRWRQIILVQVVKVYMEIWGVVTTILNPCPRCRCINSLLSRSLFSRGKVGKWKKNWNLSVFFSQVTNLMHTSFIL